MLQAMFLKKWLIFEKTPLQFRQNNITTLINRHS